MTESSGPSELAGSALTNESVSERTLVMKDVAENRPSAATASAARSVLVFLCVLLCTNVLVSAAATSTAAAATSLQRQHQHVDDLEGAHGVVGEGDEVAGHDTSSSFTDDSVDAVGTTTTTTTTPPSLSPGADVGFSTVAHRVDTRSFATCV